MRTLTTGYIVMGDRRPLTLSKDAPDWPKNGVLMFGRHATIFPSRPKAKQAIARTKKFMEKKNYGWHDKMEIWATSDNP